MGGDLSGRGAGGTVGAPMYGGLGFEAYPQTGSKAERGNRDDEQLVQRTEG